MTTQEGVFAAKLATSIHKCWRQGIFQWPSQIIRNIKTMQALVVPSLEETPEQGAEEAIVEAKVNFDYLLSMPISSLTLEKVRPPL